MQIIQKNFIKIIILTILLIGFLGIFSLHATATKTPTIALTKNSFTLLNLDKNSTASKLYKSGKLELTVVGSNDIKIVERNNRVVFWIPHHVYEATGVFHIKTGTKRYSFPIEVDLSNTQSHLDYDIFEYMFQSNLQQKSLSCESSATSDVISWFNSQHILEADIVSKLPKDQYFDMLPDTLDDGSLLWGNPDEGFVGYIDSSDELKASQSLLTGYGVHEKPIADIYKSYGFKTKIINNSLYNHEFSERQHLKYILKQLQKGNMVQLWGDWCTRLEYEDGRVQNKHLLSQKQANKKINAKNECWNVDEDRSLFWKYTDDSGNLIDHTGLNGQHAFILLGWKGNISNPTHIRVWDTDTGYHEYETIEWMRKWKAMDYRSIIVSE